MKLINSILTKTTARCFGAVVIIVLFSNILSGQARMDKDGFITHLLPSLPTYGPFEYGLVLKNDNLFYSLYGNEGETSRFVKVSDSLTLAIHSVSFDTVILLSKYKVKLLSKSIFGISAFAISGNALFLTIKNELVVCHKLGDAFTEINRHSLSFYPEMMFCNNQKLMILSLYDYHKDEGVPEKVCQIFDLSTQKLFPLINIPYDNHLFFSLVNHYVDYNKEAVLICQATSPVVLQINFDLKIDTLIYFKPNNWSQMNFKKSKLSNDGKKGIIALKKMASNYDRTLGVFFIDTSTVLIIYNKKLEFGRYHGFVFKKNTANGFEFFKEVELTQNQDTHLPPSLNVSTFRKFDNGWLFIHRPLYKINNEKYNQAIIYFDYAAFLHQ